MLKVMIAEDDLLTADMLEDVLAENGYEVCGVARTVEEGISLVERCKPDLALLDVRLSDGGLGTEIAAKLDRRGRPGILYATGNGTQIKLTNANGEAVLGKPYRTEDVIRALKIVEQIVRTGKASPPFPGGFRVLSAPSEGETGPDFSGRRGTDEVEWLLSQQAAFLSFACFAHAERNIGRVMGGAARVCAEIIGVPFCRVWRYRPGENDLVVEAVAGWDHGTIGSVLSRADESSPQIAALTTGQPVNCGDLTKNPGFILTSDYAAQGIKSVMAVVIMTGTGQKWGLLEIGSRDAETYDRNDIDFMTGFANVIAEAASHTKLNGVLQTKVERMNDMIAGKIQSASGRERSIRAKHLVLEEKLVVTQELQHRVRNNLQLVYGMLNRQVKTAADPSERQGISAIARSVITLGRVYDHLVGAGLGEKIDFGAYLSSLCSTFAEMEDPQQPKVVLNCHATKVMLDLDTVTALGLIIAELISNSYLHAFPRGTGTISVSMAVSGLRDEVTIVFADDGIGFQEAGDDKRHGLGLVRRLVRQINGSVDLRSGNGSQWTVRFPMQTLSDNDNGTGDAAPADRLLGWELPVLDRAALARSTALVKAGTIQVHLHALSGKSEALLRSLQSAAAVAGNSGALAEAVHQLVGNAGMLGFERLAFVARHVENALRAGAARPAELDNAFGAALQATIQEIESNVNQSQPI